MPAHGETEIFRLCLDAMRVELEYRGMVVEMEYVNELVDASLCGMHEVSH